MSPSPGSVEAEQDVEPDVEPDAEEVLRATADALGRRYILAADSLADVARWLAAQVSAQRENEIAHRVANCSRVLEGRRL